MSRKRQKGAKTKRETISRNNEFTGNTMAVNSYLLLITLNVNELNVPIKRQRVLEWIKKKRPINMLLTKDSF